MFLALKDSRIYGDHRFEKLSRAKDASPITMGSEQMHIKMCGISPSPWIS